MECQKFSRLEKVLLFWTLLKSCPKEIVDFLLRKIIHSDIILTNKGVVGTKVRLVQHNGETPGPA